MYILRLVASDILSRMHPSKDEVLCRPSLLRGFRLHTVLLGNCGFARAKTCAARAARRAASGFKDVGWACPAMGNSKCWSMRTTITRRNAEHPAWGWLDDEAAH